MFLLLVWGGGTFVWANWLAGRKPKSLHQAALAAGVSPGAVMTILKGANWPDIDTVARLERALDADL